MFKIVKIIYSQQVWRQLQQEEWFHGGGVSRVEAESRLQRDGDFLVRESQGSPGQYVLTGMQVGFLIWSVYGFFNERKS